MSLKAGHLAPLLILVLLFGSSTKTAEAGTSLKTAFSLEERYESNFLKSPKGSEVEDFISIFKPGISLEQSWTMLTLTASYLADIEKVARDSSSDYTAHSLFLDMKASPWEKTSMVLTENISYTPNSFDANILAKTNVLIPFTDIFYNNTYGRVTHDFTDNLHVTVSGEYSLQDFSEPSLIDTIIYSGGLIMSEDVLPRLTLTENYTYTRYSFDRGASGVSEVHLGTLGLTVTFPKSLTFILSGGVAYTPGVSSSLDISADTKWVASAQLRKDFRKSSLLLEYDRGISNAGGISSELSINDTVILSITSSITDYISASFTGTYAKQRSAPDRLLDTTYYSAALSGAWQLNRRFSLGLSYSYYAQLATASSVADDISGNIVLLTLSTLIYENRF